MADATEPDDGDEPVPPKRSKLPLLAGLALMLALGGGGFFAVYSGMILAPETPGAEAHGAGQIKPLSRVAFVPIDPLVINIGHSAANRHLRFRAELEVESGYQDEVAGLKPRILDVLNGYLRALEVTDLEEPTALIKLRAQMLRRVQMVTGEGRVNDLLVMEFVLN